MSLPPNLTVTETHPVAWHTIAADQSLTLLNSDRDRGLSQTQIEENRGAYGTNELIETGGRSSFDIFIDQFKNIMLIMLIAVALISAGLDIHQAMETKQFIFPKDAIAIFIVVLLNGVLGYVQESGAEKALAALKDLSSSKVRVIREGKTEEIDSKELVPGDLMLVEAGVKVPADGRILEAVNLQIRESALTGEAEAVLKQSDLIIAEDSAVGDRLNLVFSGTEVLQGRGTILVTEIGMKTELGKIATAMQSVEAEPTPLQKRMTQLGNVLVTGSLVLVAIVIGVGTLMKPNLFKELVEVSLSMAVAVVPEGLPAVITVTLALGTQRMVKRNALIRKLTAVETLGSVTTICSDKTGTLTQNKMVVQAVYTQNCDLRVTGEGYIPTGEFQTTELEKVETQAQPELQSLLMACLLCNDAILQKENGDWTILGDPTEGALLAAAGKAGLFKHDREHLFPRVGEFPFSSERKRMSVLVADESNQLNSQGVMMFVKGSPELTLERCTQIQIGGEIQSLSDAQRTQILEKNNQLASRGLRVLGFANKSSGEIPTTENEAEQQLTWLGLVGMLDAPRPEVRDAVAKCRIAGIRTVMITGDHPLTAQAIAQDLGIALPGHQILTGKELEQFSDADLDNVVEDVDVYARVSPQHKLRIVQALRRKHQVVAMTGDGVNDAPALKQADIGVAMGITGTDVSKEASDMVLLDDNFTTIVAAIEEGRVVYSNIRRFIRYILGSNIGEVITIAAAPILGLGGVPLSPLQILWMNLVTDGVPALALAVEPGSPLIMQRAPKDTQESIFARGLGSYMVRLGIILAVVAIAVMVWAYGYTPEHTEGGTLDPNRWKTIVFTTLCIAQMGHAMAVRSLNRLTIEMDAFSNPFLLISVLVTTLLQLLLIYVEPLRAFFGTHFLPFNELMICFGCSALIFIWIELEKVVIRLYQMYQNRKVGGNN